MLAIIAAEKDATAAMSWWNEVAAALGVGAQIDQLTVPDAMHPTRSATLRRGKEVIGAVGEIDPLVLRRFNIASRVAYLEVNLSAVLGSEPKPAQAKVVSRFPSSDIDLAFVLDSSQPAANVMRALRQAGGALVADIALFDVYRGPGVDDSARSLTFRLRLQAPDHTLTDSEIAGVREKCIAAVEKAGGTLRA
jgi:phenylalanyl-tRNA synthetase beta chain